MRKVTSTRHESDARRAMGTWGSCDEDVFVLVLRSAISLAVQKSNEGDDDVVKKRTNYLEVYL